MLTHACQYHIGNTLLSTTEEYYVTRLPLKVISMPIVTDRFRVKRWVLTRILYFLPAGRRRGSRPTGAGVAPSHTAQPWGSPRPGPCPAHPSLHHSWGEGRDWMPRSDSCHQNFCYNKTVNDRQQNIPVSLGWVKGCYLRHLWHQQRFPLEHMLAQPQRLRFHRVQQTLQVKQQLRGRASLLQLVPSHVAAEEGVAILLVLETVLACAHTHTNKYRQISKYKQTAADVYKKTYNPAQGSS